MCDGHGFLGNLFGGSGLGGILGGLAGGALDFFAPELGVPLALATGAGSALGSTVGGVASGEPIGKALTGGLESGAITGGLTGLGEVVGGNDFFAAPGGAGAGATAGDLSSTLLAAPVDAGSAGAAVPALGGAAATAGAPLAPVTAAPLGGGVATGAGVGSPIGGLASSTGAAGPLDLTGSISTGAGNPAFMGTLTQDVGDSLPTSGSGGLNSGSAFDAAGHSVPLGSPAATDAFGGAGSTDGGSLGSKLMSTLEKNPGLLLAGGGLLTSILSNNSIPGLGSIQNQAGLLAGQGNQNITALNTGQLPAGAQAMIDQDTAAAKAQIRSTFDRLGAPGTTSEAQALAGVDQSAAAAKIKDLTGVAQLGLNEVGMANDLYRTIMGTQLAQDAETQAAIARLAAALAGQGTVRTAAA